MSNFYISDFKVSGVRYNRHNLSESFYLGSFCLSSNKCRAGPKPSLIVLFGVLFHQLYETQSKPWAYPKLNQLKQTWNMRQSQKVNLVNLCKLFAVFDGSILEIITQWIESSIDSKLLIKLFTWMKILCISFGC